MARADARAVLCASNTLVGAAEMPLASGLELALRRIAFPRAAYCDRCWSFASDPAALTPLPRSEDDDDLRRMICGLCLARINAESCARAKDAHEAAGDEGPWLAHKKACPSCRRGERHV